MLIFLLVSLFKGSYVWAVVAGLAAWLGVWLFVYRKKMQKAWFFISMLLLLGALWGVIHITSVQNWIVGKVTNTLSRNLHTKVVVKHVDFSLFNKMLIEGVLVEDKKHDTLLYAGTAKVNISDWFFLKDKATLEYIGLKNAVININRTDSVWNYQFLADYFSGPKDTTQKKGGLQIDLKTLELENIRFNKIDKWVGKDIIVAVKKLDLTADEFDLKNKHIAINAIKIDAPFFAQNNYLGDPSQELPDVKVISPGQKYKWNNAGWVISVKNIAITNGAFKNDKQSDVPPYTEPDRFDGQHILFTALNGDLNNVRFEKDTLTTDVDLATKEKSGFEIKKLQARMKFTPDMMEFNELDLVTNKSRLGNYYAMRYEDFNIDMSAFMHNVKLEGRFENSHLHSDDLAFFAPALKIWNRIFYIKGEAKGTIDNLTAKKMLIKSGNTVIDGDIALRGLPDIKKTFIDFKANDLRTNYADAVAILPMLRNVTQVKLNRLGAINFKGNFTGFINDFVAFGNINTSLGNINADINMKLPENAAPNYSGNISSTGFNIGQFLDNNQLGNIALDGKIKGSGFKLKDLNTNFNGNIHQLAFANYVYHNITINGDFKKDLFSGHGSIDDPNLQLENFDGSISLGGKETQFNFDALLHNANLKNLKLTLDNFQLAGHFNLDFKGNNIDNFLGTARVYNATLIHDSTRLSFDSLTLRSLIDQDKKYLALQSNQVDATLSGNFKILELDDAFKVFLNRYYPAYIKKPSYTVSDQDFDFLIKTKNVDEYIQLIDKRLRGFNNSTIAGNIKLSKNELNVNADVPEFSYDGKTFLTTHLESKGGLDSLLTTISVSDIGISDSLHLPETKLTIASKNDISDISLKTSASKTISDAELNARIQTLNDGVVIHFFPSSFIINDKKWDLKKDGELTIRKSFVEANQVTFSQNDQQIIFSTEMDELTDKTNVIAKLKRVNINDFTPLLFKNPRLEGVLSGTITLRDPFGKQQIEFDTEAENFVLEDKHIGTTTLKGDVNTQTGLIRFRSKADGSDYKFDIDGTYNYKDSSENQMAIALTAERFDISILNKYLNTVFSDIKGSAVSDLKISGGAKHTYITGSVTINEGSLKVLYTQCRYKFSNETILFNPDEMDIGTIQLTDTLNNPGVASGKMYYHNIFEDIAFDNVTFRTGLLNAQTTAHGKMLLLNTTKRDNSSFYGKVIGTADMSLNGPVTNMNMVINGEPSPTDSSHIYLPTGSSKEAGKIDYIDFVQFGTEMQFGNSSKQASNISVDINLAANPACKIDVILDEATGDVIKGQGNGILNIHAGSNEQLTMRGRYDITQGEYTFNFQTWLKKFFTINTGSIVWNGDPYLATLNIDAEYLAKDVDLSSIASSKGFRQRDDLSIIAHITGILNKPQIDFEFKLPPKSELSKDFIALKKLQDYRNDKNEMLKQVASLLLVNSFITDQSTLLGGSNTYAFAANTIGQVLSNALTNTFNSLLQKALKDPTIKTYFDVSSYLNLQSTANQLQGAAKFGITKSYFNNRLIISFGGNINYNNPYLLTTKNSNVLLTPDFTAEWLLSKDGKVRVIGFRRTNIDYTFGQRNSQGVSLTYRTDFDRIAELFAPSEEKKKKREMKAEEKAKAGGN